MSRVRLLLLASVLFVGASGAIFVRWSANANPEKQAAADSTPVLVVTSTLSPKQIVLYDELPGRVAAYRRVEIRPQVGGVITQRLVEEGTRVDEGQILFQIDPAPLKADLEIAEAGLKRATAQKAHARRNLERADMLLAKNVASREQNDNARNELALAEAGLAEATAVVERRRLDLEFATLRSPIRGYIGSGLADVGGLASSSSERALAVVQDVDRVYLDLRLPAARLDAVQLAAADGVGAIEVLNPDGVPHTRPGRLKSSDIVVDPGTGNASVRVEVENPDLSLLPGMYVRVKMPRGVISNALLVPEEAVLRSGPGEAQVVVVGADGRAERRDVRLGDAVGGRVVATSGLSAGEVIAVRGQDRVQNGMPVTTTRFEQATPPADGQP